MPHTALYQAADLALPSLGHRLHARLGGLRRRHEPRAFYIRARLSPALPPQRLAGGNSRSRFQTHVSFVAVGWPVLSRQP